MPKEHRFIMSTVWHGNLGTGTSGYKAYSRDHEIRSNAKQSVILGSSDPAFRGDGARYNPEELLIASISSCHMLWALHLCADAGIIVTEYEDHAEGTMVESEDGGGQFSSVVLHPRMTINDGEKKSLAKEMHEKAHSLCFIARSVNFSVTCKPEIVIG